MTFECIPVILYMKGLRGIIVVNMESGMSAHGLNLGQDEMFSFHTNSLRKGMT